MKDARLNRFQIRRMRRSSRRFRILVLLALLGLGVAAAIPILTGRTTPRWYRLQAAKNAMTRAQDAGAATWAPDALSQARAMMQVAMVEHRHQELRVLPLRDFSQAEALLVEAEARADRAREAAVRKRRTARNTSQEAITRAAQAVGRGVAFADVMHLGRYDRTTLQRAKLHLEEAELLQRAGKYTLAMARAQSATAGAQQVSERAAKSAARYTDSGLVQNWRRWIDETVEWSRKTGDPAIVVFKEKHLVTLYARGKPVRSYAAELGSNTVGDKLRAGDLATPEGRYHITAKKPVGQSTYHMALLLNYPNDEDRRQFEAAKRAGRLSKRAQIGGLIEIHGDGGKGRDWTKGCVALDNADISDLFDRVRVGTPVTIVGGDGNGGTFTRLVDLHRAGSDAGVD